MPSLCLARLPLPVLFSSLMQQMLFCIFSPSVQQLLYPHDFPLRWWMGVWAPCTGRGFLSRVHLLLNLHVVCGGGKSLALHLWPLPAGSGLASFCSIGCFPCEICTFGPRLWCASAISALPAGRFWVRWRLEGCLAQGVGMGFQICNCGFCPLIWTSSFCSVGVSFRCYHAILARRLAGRLDCLFSDSLHSYDQMSDVEVGLSTGRFGAYMQMLDRPFSSVR